MGDNEDQFIDLASVALSIIAIAASDARARRSIVFADPRDEYRWILERLQRRMPVPDDAEDLGISAGDVVLDGAPDHPLADLGKVRPGLAPE
jgi:hypothetical protein